MDICKREESELRWAGGGAASPDLRVNVPKKTGALSAWPLSAAETYYFSMKQSLVNLLGDRIKTIKKMYTIYTCLV